MTEPPAPWSGAPAPGPPVLHLDKCCLVCALNWRLETDLLRGERLLERVAGPVGPAHRVEAWAAVIHPHLANFGNLLLLVT